jgi:membrane-bound ClpP family serine protease
MPQGVVYAAGEEWSARSLDGRPIERGTSVRVVGHDGLTLLVEPAGFTGSAATTRLGPVG